ncbi:type II toxin-antitoxin system RelE family toxin [Phosphitispora sp. TUW77]|uniref:type II toxin-antitoxin system RelE family toxin n=1 Tax=Phosphitispora sp. TUW77 TaxID=3152361 RepID=UPI003AB41D27
MTRKFRSTRKFDKQYKSLDPNTIKQATKTIELFIKDPSHPSLRYKKVQGTDNFFEISVNISVRIIVEVLSEGKDQINTFYIIGKHEDVFPVD